MDGYVSKNDVIPLKELFDEMLSSVRKDVKREGITFTCNLVGSAKRNLVVCHPTKGIDCDYQLILQSNKNGLNLKSKDYFAYHLIGIDRQVFRLVKIQLPL